MALSTKQKKTLQDLGADLSQVRNVNAGHMAYHHFIVPAGRTAYFVKAYDPSLFTDPIKSRDALRFLQKEAAVYDHLAAHGFTAIPQYHRFIDNMLILEALTPENGWYWRVPSDPKLRQKYLDNILKTFGDFSELPQVTDEYDERKSMDILKDDGWQKLSDQDLSKIVSDNLERWQHKLHASAIQTGKRAVKDIHKAREMSFSEMPFTLSHHDARQANIAWHPEHGARLVDMSWAGAGPKTADETMLIIDLRKAEIPVPDGYMQSFDPQHAHTMLGYWLQRSREPSLAGNEDVRFHQFVSALVTYDLLNTLTN